MIDMYFAYVLARKDYFERGHNGSVTHAVGIADGLAKLIDLDIYSSPSSKRYIKSKKVNAVNFSNSIYWHFGLLSALFKSRKKYDFVIVRYSTSLGWLYCLVLNLILRKNWGFELNSLGYQQLQSASKLKSLLGKFVLRPFENLIMGLTPYVNCVSENLEAEISRYAKNTYVLPNAGYINEIDVKRVASEKTKIIYFGMYHYYYDLIGLAKTIASLSDVELHCYGAGDQEACLTTISQTSKNIFLHGRYKFEDLISSGVFDGNIFLVLPYKSGTIADYGSPTKLFEYLSLGLPIISTQVSQPYQILKQLKLVANDAVFFYDSDFSSVIDEIKQSASFDRNEALSYFKNNHTWDIRAEDYIYSIKVFLNKK